MGYPNSRISYGSRDTSWQWLARPRPLQGESLSSLLARVSNSNGVDWRFFCKRTLGTAMPRDIDMPSVPALANIATRLGLNVSQVNNCSRHAGAFDYVASGQTFLRSIWVLPSWYRRVYGGIPICPACIDEAGMAHLQLAWRYAFSAYCLKHRSPLVDSCPACDTPVTISIGNDGVQLPGSHCVHCQRSLHPPRSNSESMPWYVFQAGLCSVEQPTCWKDVGAMHPSACLTGVRTFITLLRLPYVKPGPRAMAMRQHLDLPTELREPTRNFWSFEYTPATHRTALLNGIANLLSDWPNHFLNFAEQTSLRSNDFRLKHCRAPYWLDNIVNANLYRRKYSLSPDEVAAAAIVAKRNAGPITRAAVASLLGTRDSVAMDKLYGRKRRRMTQDEVYRFFSKSISGLQEIPEARTQRAAAQRTLIMVAFCVVSNMEFEDVCRIENSQVAGLLKRFGQELRDLLGSLEIPLPGQTPNGRYFLSREGQHLAGPTPRMLASRLIREYGPPDCWASVDALRQLGSARL